MLTVNLEKQLIKQNKKVLLPEELLSIKEYERLGDDVCESEVLSRIGLNQVARWGMETQKEQEGISKRLSKFDSDRVFHISQIEAICRKYHLRFLPTENFKGSIDASLADKISTFEASHTLKCDRYRCKIVAPKSSFDLKERPKDPLFFYELGNGYWYLIHKWGNDLSLFRRFYNLLSNGLVTWLIVCILPCFLFFRFGKVWEVVGKRTEATVFTFGFGIYFVVFTILAFMVWVSSDDDTAIRLVKKNDWDSSYK